MDGQIILNNLKILNFNIGSSNPILFKVVEDENRNYEYDVNGNPTTVIDKPGRGGNSYWLKYDDLGRVIEERIKHIYSDEIQVYSFEYDQNNNLLSRTHINKANIIEKNVYDLKNRVIETSKVNSLGQLVLSKKYFYDDRGKIEREVFYNDSGQVDSETLFHYNENKKLTHEDYNLYNINGSIEGSGVRAYKYDAFGSKIEFSHIHRKTLLKIASFQYDKFHNLIVEFNFDPSNEERQTKTYFYEKERVVRVRTQAFNEPKGTVAELVYEYYDDFVYDSDGNKIIAIHRGASFEEESRSTVSYKKIEFN